MKQEEKSLRELARKLAINHYNVSVATDSRDGENLNNKDFTPGLDKILTGDISGKIYTKELGFSRNILIVGAGASKNAYDFYKITSEVITKIQESLDFDTAFQNSKIRKKYIEEASKIAGFIFENSNFDEIPDKVGFEGYLRLLSIFFTEEDLSIALKRAIKDQKSKDDFSDFLPSLFYEIVAHLFKHRYIDVIVNLNFDELLDNAVEDDLGLSTYHRIISDLDCKSFEEIVDNKRLRIPIYIKPHGSFRSRSSMRFTKEHYILLPSEIKDILIKILDGDTGVTENKVRRFNIIFAGYGLFDIDIQKILFEQLWSFLNDGAIELNYYIFDIKKEKAYIELFIGKFKNWLEKKLPKKEYYDEKNLIKNDIEKKIDKIRNCLHIITCDTDPEENELKDIKGLGYIFRDLYGKIQDEFRINSAGVKRDTPFTPRNLTRHELISVFFPRNVLLEKFKNDTFIPEEYFLKRARFNALYAFIKYKGRIPINVLISDRSGKYLEKYCQIIKKNRPTDNDITKTSLIAYIQKLFGEGSVTIENSFVKHESFYEDKIFIKDIGLRDGFDKIFKFIIQQMFHNSYTNQTEAKDYGIESRLLLEVFDTRTSEINAIYEDQKHRRFYPFGQEKIINTNLELTWKFFSFAIEGDWDTLCLIDDTGKAIYNLHILATEAPTYLTRIAKSNKRILFLNSIADPRKFNFELFNNKRIIPAIRKVFIKEENGQNFVNGCITGENNFHKMALFLKEKNPVFGIYYFQPGTKVKINPVYFDKSSDSNLKLMKNIFARTIPKQNDLEFSEDASELNSPQKISRETIIERFDFREK